MQLIWNFFNHSDHFAFKYKFEFAPIHYVYSWNSFLTHAIGIIKRNKITIGRQKEKTLKLKLVLFLLSLKCFLFTAINDKNYFLSILLRVSVYYHSQMDV